MSEDDLDRMIPLPSTTAEADAIVRKHSDVWTRSNTSKGRRGRAYLHIYPNNIRNWIEPLVLEGTGRLCSAVRPIHHSIGAAAHEVENDLHHYHEVERALQDKQRVTAAFFRLHPHMRSISHEISQNRIDESKNISPFYRRLLLSYTPIFLLTGVSGHVEFAWLDRSGRRPTHGVTFNDAIRNPERCALLPLKALGRKDIKTFTSILTHLPADPALVRPASPKRVGAHVVGSVSEMEQILKGVKNASTGPASTASAHPVHFYPTFDQLMIQPVSVRFLRDGTATSVVNQTGHSMRLVNYLQYIVESDDRVQAFDFKPEYYSYASAVITEGTTPTVIRCTFFLRP